MKVFFAKDIHKLYKNSKPLILGGVEVNNAKYSIVAHSDGDLICHSITSCMLAAIGEKTIGEIYPDDNPIYKNKDSTFFLCETLDKLNNLGVNIENIDITIVCEKILLKNYLEKIKSNLIHIIKNNNITIKVTRYEQDIEMIECYCVLTIT